MTIKKQEKFKDKYRINSQRLKGWDYATPGLYFITICTKDRINFFGEINNNQMKCNDIGEIAQKNWKDIPNHFQNVELDKFVIMPNHLHGILKIMTRITVPEREQKNNYYSKISPKSQSIATIIRSYKSACTKRINELSSKTNFAWQPGFYDVIIKDNDALKNIRNYIIKNPANWNKDLQRGRNQI